MPLFTWSNTYSVGVETLDSQHTNLFAIMNGLHDAMRAGQGQQVTGPMLRRLVKYTQTHFAAEEMMMEATGYPGLARHRIQHLALTQKVFELMTQFERSEVTVKFDLLAFLHDWWINHIQHEDKEYGPWMKQRAAQ
jgi:hemerythrin